ncbi:hypothetical protein ACXPWS_10560 [Mycobacterium sp. BMJ-28]
MALPVEMAGLEGFSAMVEPAAWGVPVLLVAAAARVAHSPGSAVPEVTGAAEQLSEPVVTAVQVVTPKDWCGPLVVPAAMAARGSGWVSVGPADPVVPRTGGCSVSAGVAATEMMAGLAVSVVMEAT